MDTYGVTTQLPLELADCFKEWQTLYVSYCSSNLRNNEIIMMLLPKVKHIPLYLIRDMRYDLNGFSQIIPTTFFFYHALIDTSCCHIIMARCLNSGETFIVAEIQVCFLPIIRHIAFPVFIRIEGSRIHIYIRIKFLYGHIVPASL